MKTHSPLLLFVAPVLLAATSAWGFDALRTPGGRVVHAPRTPWPVYLQADPIDQLSVNRVESVTVAAIAAWNAVSDTKVQLRYGGLVRQAPHLGVYILREPAFQWAHTDGTARTDLEVDTDGGLRQATIALNGNDFQWITGTKTSGSDGRPGADLQSVLTHQLGHALGLSHTHDPTATMYFWGTGRAGRTLTADDARALRFVYPAIEATASTTCDPCRSDADCAGTGRCLAWPDGFAYCAAPCKSHEDCPIGTSCGAYSSGIACLPNDGHCNADRAVDHAGEACASDFACVDADLCMPITSGQGFCTSGCSSDFDCAVGATCSPGAYCVEHGAGIDGSVCRVPGDCASGACMASVLRTGSCGRGCSGTCGNGESCGDDGFCRPACAAGKTCPDGLNCGADAVCRGPLAIGWPCSSAYDCAEGSCVTLTGLRFDAVCSKSCNVPADCPDGTGCSTTSKGKLCVPGPQLTLGSPCTSSASCGTGLGCDFGATLAGFGTCARACDPFGASAECQGGWCAWTGDAHAAAGICRNTAGGVAPGQVCDGTQVCRSDLVCAQATGDAVCSRSCDPTAPICDAGLTCIGLAGTSARGVCMDGGASATEIPRVVVKSAVNLDGRVVMLPQVVPIAAFQPGKTSTTTIVSNQGCSANRTAPQTSGLLVWLAAIGLWLARRLRRG